MPKKSVLTEHSDIALEYKDVVQDFIRRLAVQFPRFRESGGQLIKLGCMFQAHTDIYSYKIALEKVREAGQKYLAF